MQPLAAAAATPLKALMNLTTSVDNLAFSPDTQVLIAPGHFALQQPPFSHHPSPHALRSGRATLAASCCCFRVISQIFVIF